MAMHTNLTNPNTQVNPMAASTKIVTVSNSAFTSIINDIIFKEVNDAQVSVICACALTDAVAYPDDFLEMWDYSMGAATLTTGLNNKMTDIEVSFDTEELAVLLVKLGFMTEEGKPGDVLLELKNQEVVAYAPTMGEIVRRYPNHKLEKGQKSKLTTESLYALEDTWFTRDDYMVELRNQWQAKTGGAEKDPEAYVLAGCNAMSSSNSYHSEFMCDTRDRKYQAACHGPIGAASDSSRAMMDLAGVPMDYDAKEAYKHILHEMEDMVTSDVAKHVVELNTIGALEFVLKHDSGEYGVKKCWSFVKAARIMKALKAGERPYIGMAVGLDAKCSGPQLAALMVGDEDIAAACGFSKTKVADAYQRCVEVLEKYGFYGFSRNGVKKAYMAVFYGQGWAAFANIAELRKESDYDEVVAILYPNGVVSDDIAKRFHKAITSSFGAKLKALRERFKDYNGKVEGRIGHCMPDGFKVQMNYKIKWNINNEAMEFGVDAPDVIVKTGETTRKFIRMQLNTRTVDTASFVRNGFVNLVQATDALIAKLIIVNLKRMGAQHIISVHDCFRVNVTEMHLLKAAIIAAYTQLFGSQTNIKTDDLPMGQDILSLYFEGANKQLIAGEKVVAIPQFLPFGPKPRKMRKVNGVDTQELINALGQTYYFAK